MAAITIMETDMSAVYNMSMDSHSDFKREFQIKSGITIVDITDYTFAMKMRAQYGSPTSHDATCSIVDAATGKFCVEYSDTTTADIKPGDYLYDIVMTDDSDKKTTLLRGTVTVHGGITR